MLFLHACENRECLRTWADAQNDGKGKCPFCKNPHTIIAAKATIREDHVLALKLNAPEARQDPHPAEVPIKSEPEDGEELMPA